MRNARRWQHFGGSGLSLDYPAGWLANFTGNGPAWFVDPNTQGMMFGLGQAYTGDAGSAAEAQVGHTLEQAIASSMHPGLRIVAEDTQGGPFRWLAVYPSKDGKSQNIELGQVVLGNGHFSVVWGDTTVDQVSTNLPLFERTLDSAAQAAGMSPPSPATVSAIIQLIQKNPGTSPSATNSNGRGDNDGNNGNGTTAPQDPGSAGTALALQEQLDRQNEAYMTLSNIEQEQHDTFMTMMGYSIEYVPVSW